MFARFLIRYPYLLWLTGFLLPAMYVVYFLQIPRIVYHFKKVNLTILLILAFVGVQLISAFFSVAYDFFSFERLAAILHNILAFSFLFLGYSLMKEADFNSYVKKYTEHVYYILFGIILIATLISLYKGVDLVLPTFFSMIGVESKFLEVRFNLLDWYMMSDFPRTMVMGIYPNSTGLLYFFLYIIIMSLNFNDYSNRKKFLITLLLFIVSFLTGSRTYLLLSSAFFLILFIKNKSRLSILSLLTPLILIVSIIAVEYLMGLRSGSNDARSMIYEGSFKLMLATNPLLGIGIKPRLPELIGVPYPLGSHSTHWGYVIKTGFIGTIFLIVLIGVPVFRYIEMVILQLFSKNSFSRQSFFILSAIVIMLIALSVEDLDAYEILPFYFGIIVWIYDNRREIANS